MKWSSFMLRTLCWLALLGSSAVAQPLPKISLLLAFPELEIKNPVRMEEAPDNSGRFFIVEQDGRIVIVRKGADGANAKEFLNLEDRKPHGGLEEGLLGLAFPPQFRNNGLVYIYYSQHDPRRSVVSEFKVSAEDSDRADLKSERVLMEIPQPFDCHKAGQVAFGPDGDLYIGLGDGGAGNDPFNNAQNTAVLLGKILRIDVNSRSTVHAHNAAIQLPYGIPNDNPFVNEPEFWEYSVRREIWAYGLRNPFRFSFDRETGDLWAGDVGQDSWEEVDLITKGGNYGWCVREGAHHFKPGPDGAHFIDPVIEYPHDPKMLSQSKFPNHGTGSCIIGGNVYRGRQFPALRGVYVYADYVLGTFWGFRYQNGRITKYGKLLEQPKNISAFAEDREGEFYALAYDGHIYSITVPPVERFTAKSLKPMFARK